MFLLFFLVSFPSSPIETHARQRIISLNFRGDTNSENMFETNTDRPTDRWLEVLQEHPVISEISGISSLWPLLLSANSMATKHKPAPQKVVIQTWLKLNKHPAGSGKI